MTYKDTIEYLYSTLPMFTKVGSSAIKPGLKNIEHFCETLGHPENKFKTIHVGGTNGKGSSSHMLASIFQSAGYKTGLYTSPHLLDFRERIRVNGEMIPETEVINFVEKHKTYIDTLQPSFFETTVAMAFNYFADEKVDIAIIEVGLGGRLDSTNIITPEISLITNISFDHTAILGNSIAAIASEKAGIIKPNQPVIIGEFNPESAPIFIKKAAENNSNILFADQTLTAEVSSIEENHLFLNIYSNQELMFENLKLDLKGSYQQKNIKGVLTTIIELNKQGWKISEAAIKNGLANVKKLTGLAGRWHQLKHQPLVFCDTGHNEAGIEEVLKNIQNTSHKQLHMVFGMVKDKDISKVLSMLPTNATYYFCTPSFERGLPPTELKSQAQNFGLNGTTYTSVKNAYEAALKVAENDDLIFIGGSTFVVAEIL
ncbi:bifunctional folylpolyglutamate synthase/dihydrofolate synthase [Pedobacter flavus]|uniref:Dihydrofolate synthase/folylpolyglutamate synthase n=1 Tax=Pedobacter flavus TaxID=3113906 RepID=A0ABU7H3U2_9SPHI|nr:folylpolyglutamate synthase/dihydrofolate synthase family protein [Pedobacter sp. VNH31]MEE1885997.1 folylpolyglutamate synthase/dihydrofolate synthase family protein [Pedobacter sp. VNH31]